MRKIFEIASEKQGAKQLEHSVILFQYISLVNKLGVKKSQEDIKTIFGADEDSAASLGRTARAPASVSGYRLDIRPAILPENFSCRITARCSLLLRRRGRRLASHARERGGNQIICDKQ